MFSPVVVVHPGTYAPGPSHPTPAPVASFVCWVEDIWTRFYSSDLGHLQSCLKFLRDGGDVINITSKQETKP